MNARPNPVGTLRLNGFVMGAALGLPIVLAIGIGLWLRAEGLLSPSWEWVIVPLGMLGSVLAVSAYALWSASRLGAMGPSISCPHCGAPMSALGAPGSTGRCPSCGGALVPDRMLGAGGREASLRRRFESERLGQLAKRSQAIARFKALRASQVKELFVMGYLGAVPGLLAILLSVGLIGELLGGRIGEVHTGIFAGTALCWIVFLLALRGILRRVLPRRSARRIARPGLDRAKAALEARGDALILATSESRRAWLNAYWPGSLPPTSLELRPSARVMAVEREEVPVWIELDLHPETAYGRILAAVWDYQGERELEGASLTWAPHGLRLDLGSELLDALRGGDPAPLTALLEGLDRLLREGEGLPAARLGVEPGVEQSVEQSVEPGAPFEPEEKG